ncbi:MAG: hypothetical protein LUQ70_00660 [Methanobacteriaceae archaeon]|nr:hypothetical protein [Methanobacteriaceae archaeon]
MTPVDVFFYVLEGNGILEIGDEKKEVSQDTLMTAQRASLIAGTMRVKKPSAF